MGSGARSGRRVASACARPSAAPTRQTVRIGTGSQQGNYYPVGVALARTFATAMPDVDVEVKVTDGTLANLDALQSGSVDVAFSYADVAYATYVGGPGDQGKPFTGLRALACCSCCRCSSWSAIDRRSATSRICRAVR